MSGEELWKLATDRGPIFVLGALFIWALFNSKLLLPRELAAADKANALLLASEKEKNAQLKEVADRLAAVVAENTRITGAAAKATQEAVAALHTITEEQRGRDERNGRRQR